MTVLSVESFAEEPDRHLPDPSPPSRRILDPRYVLFFGPTPLFNFVTSIRVDPGDVDGLVTELRGLAAKESRRLAWMIGPSCTPDDLEARLREHGCVLADTPPFEPVITAMALTRAPDLGELDGVVVREIESFEDFTAADEIVSSGFGASEGDRAALAVTASARFEGFRGRGDHLRFLALVYGAPVASASAHACESGLFLAGAATLPDARGRGAYRALVAARWKAAVARGTPALVIQAGAMSRPILERVGFHRYCDLSVLLDPSTPG